jgi:hypothetical protein
MNEGTHHVGACHNHERRPVAFEPDRVGDEVGVQLNARVPRLLQNDPIPGLAARVVREDRSAVVPVRGQQRQPDHDVELRQTLGERIQDAHERRRDGHRLHDDLPLVLLVLLDDVAVLGRELDQVLG